MSSENGSNSLPCVASQNGLSEIDVGASAPRKAKPGRPRKRVNATSMTLTISQADKDLVKEYAFAHAVSVSDLLHQWIRENCAEV